MPITVVNIGTHNSNSGPNQIVVPAGGVPAGSLICFCAMEVISSAAVGSVADDSGNQYAIGISVNINSDQVALGLIYAQNVSALSSGQHITYTPNNAGAATSVSAFYATGLAVSSAYDNASDTTATGVSTSPSILSFTPTVPGELFVGLVAYNNTQTFNQDTTNAAWAAPPTLIVGSGTNWQIAGGSVIDPTTAQMKYNPSFTGGVASWGMLISSFLPFTAPSVGFAGLAASEW